MAGVKGRSGRQKYEPIVTDAFRLAALRIMKGDPEGRSYLAAAVESVVEQAAAGDLDAFKVLAERLEGKPRQAVEVTGEDGGPLTFVIRDLVREGE